VRTRPPEPHTLAGAYALDALTGADRTRFERHLTRCEQCAREITSLREATARLGAAAAAKPPARLIERALAAAARTRQLPPVTRDPARSWPGRHAAAAGAAHRAARPLRRPWMPRLALAVAGAAVVLAGFLGLAARGAQHQLQQDQSRSHEIAAVLTAGDAHMLSASVSTGGTATVVMSGREHSLVFAAAGLRALPSSRSYELWLMGPTGDRAAAMLPAPRQGMTGPVLASGLEAGDRLGLTVEPASGSPRPTSPVIMQLAL
jgi:anti-sigma-K factor RskA